MKNKKNFVALVVALLFVSAFAFSASMVVAKKGNGNGGSENSGQSSEKSGKIKDFEKPEKEKTNAKIHKEKSDEISDELKGVAKKEEEKNQNKNKGADKQEKEKNKNGAVEDELDLEEEVADEIEEVADEIEEASEETAEAIEGVESQNKFKKFLVGTDYKNLGQLRSSLVKNENQIRKLTRISQKTMGEETDSVIDDQLVVLMQERERIKSVIQENQEGFSILGWAVKLFGGYTEEEIDEENEQDIEEEVKDVLEGGSSEGEEGESGEEVENVSGEEVLNEAAEGV